jgi:hypothetical protein
MPDNNMMFPAIESLVGGAISTEAKILCWGKKVGKLILVY